MDVDNQTVTEEDVVRCLLEEGVWINNPDVDALEEGARKRSTKGKSAAELRYLRETVFPTLVPALHELLRELEATIRKSTNAGSSSTTPSSLNHSSAASEVADGSSSTTCPFRSIANGGQKASGTETFGQAVTHTSQLRRRDTTQSSTDAANKATPAAIVDSILKLVEEGSPNTSAPFYGPTGRCHPVEYLAQLLIRNNVGPLSTTSSSDSASYDASAADGYAKHPYVIIEQHAAKNNKPGYW